MRFRQRYGGLFASLRSRRPPTAPSRPPAAPRARRHGLRPSSHSNGTHAPLSRSAGAPATTSTAPRRRATAPPPADPLASKMAALESGIKDVTNMMATLSLDKEGKNRAHVALASSMMAMAISPVMLKVPHSTCTKLREGKLDPNNASSLHKKSGAGFWTVNGMTFLALTFSGRMHYSVEAESVWSQVSATVPHKTKKKKNTIPIWNPLIALCADAQTKIAIINAVDELNKCAYYNQSDRRIFIRDPGTNYTLKRGFKDVGKPPVYLTLWCSHDFTAVEALFYGQLQGHLVLPTCFNTQVRLPSGEEKGFNPIYTVTGAAAENIMDKVAFFTDTDMEDEDYDYE